VGPIILRLFGRYNRFVLSLSEGREEIAGERRRSPGRLFGEVMLAFHALVSTRIVAMLLRPGAVAERRDQEYYDAATTPLRQMLWRPALLGFVGSAAIAAGASQPNSPFTLKLPGAWWFGIPAAHPAPQIGGPGQWLFLGVIAVYGGMLLMLRAWYDVIQLTSRVKGAGSPPGPGLCRLDDPVVARRAVVQQ